jgi:hypothetical protein
MSCPYRNLARNNAGSAAWVPLRRPLFRALWIADVVSNNRVPNVRYRPGTHDSLRRVVGRRILLPDVNDYFGICFNHRNTPP